MDDRPGKPFLFLSLSGLELKYRACRDHRGRFAACGGGGARSQDIAHIRGRSGQPTKPGPHDRETYQAPKESTKPKPPPGFQSYSPEQERAIAASSGKVRGRSLLGGKATDNRDEVAIAAAAVARRTGETHYVYGTYQGYQFGREKPPYGQSYLEMHPHGYRQVTHEIPDPPQALIDAARGNQGGSAKPRLASEPPSAPKDKLAQQRQAANDRLDRQITRDRQRREETVSTIQGHEEEVRERTGRTRQELMRRGLEAERLRRVRDKLRSMNRRDYSRFPTGRVRSVLDKVHSRKPKT
jgi:hypothetical protein